MKRLLILTLIGVMTWCFGQVSPVQAQGKWSPEVMKVIDAAKKEGKVNFYGVNLSPQALKKLEQAFNATFGTNLVMEHEPSRHFGTKAITLVSEGKAGLQIPNDAVNMNSSGMGLLAREGLLRDQNWVLKNFPDIKAEWLINDNQAMMFWHGVYGPVYNTNLVSKDRLPKQWEDLLSPAWKDKMIMSTGLDQFTALAESWGVDRVKDYLTKLKNQNIAIDRGASATLQRVAAGEFPLAATQIYGTMKRIQRGGAPIEMAFLEPVPMSSTYLVLPKNSPHPNAGMLFSAFIMSPDGHAVWEQASGLSNAYVSSSSLTQVLKGKKLAAMSPEWALKGEDLVIEWSKALGIRAEGGSKKKK
ncbi:MAG: extracellular solute-binding protein [Desulfobacterales bacterium]|nr:extracellular solute-binding protein [Desulfobacterales bacterium]